MIKVTSRGEFRKTRDFLNKMLRRDIFSDLDRYGKLGVAALRASTPIDSGKTAAAWEYRIIKTPHIRIEWYNTNHAAGTSVAILIQYGHGTGSGGWVQGRDYINPAMRPLFDQIAEDIGKKVRK